MLACHKTVKKRILNCIFCLKSAGRSHSSGPSPSPTLSSTTFSLLTSALLSPHICTPLSSCGKDEWYWPVNHSYCEHKQQCRRKVWWHSWKAQSWKKVTGKLPSCITHRHSIVLFIWYETNSCQFYLANYGINWFFRETRIFCTFCSPLLNDFIISTLKH